MAAISLDSLAEENIISAEAHAALSVEFFSAGPPPLAVQNIFVDRLWPTSSQLAQIDAIAYFDFVRQQREATLASAHAIQTYGDIVTIVDYVREHQGSSLGDIVRDLASAEGPFDAEVRPRVELSIELAMRLWLMLNIRCFVTSDNLQRSKIILWPEADSLDTVLGNYLRCPFDNEGADKFEEHLNTVDLKRIGGFRVRWTSELSAHLTLRKTTIHMFHNVSVLKRMGASTGFPLPKTYLNETVATIGLFVPVTIPSCNRWLASEISQNKLDDKLKFRLPPSYLRADYPRWQQDITEIAEAFEMTKPRTFMQWFYDRRDTERWWGFWLLISGIFLTVLFGLIQSITGIIQVVRPNRL